METKCQPCEPRVTKLQQNPEHQGSGKIFWLARWVRIATQCGWEEELPSVTPLGEGNWGGGSTFGPPLHPAPCVFFLGWFYLILSL